MAVSDKAESFMGLVGHSPISALGPSLGAAAFASRSGTVSAAVALIMVDSRGDWRAARRAQTVEIKRAREVGKGQVCPRLNAHYHISDQRRASELHMV